MPWANGNLEEWLYRPVRFAGRKIHRHEMNFPSVNTSGFEGNWVFVPCVTKEAEDFDPATREGLILGIGWIPATYKSIYHRGEDGQSYDYETFEGIVTTNEELQVGLFNKRGNIANEQQFEVSTPLLAQITTTCPKWPMPPCLRTENKSKWPALSVSTLILRKQFLT